MNEIKSTLTKTTQFIKDSYLSILSVILVLSWFKTTIYYDVFQIDIWSYVDVFDLPKIISISLLFDLFLGCTIILILKIIYHYLIKFISNENKSKIQEYFLISLWVINIIIALLFFLLSISFRSYYLLLPVSFFLIEIFLFTLKKLNNSYFYSLTLIICFLCKIFYSNFYEIIDKIKAEGKYLPYINNDKKLKLIGMTNNYYFVLNLKNNKTDILNKNSNISISLDNNFLKK